MILLESFLANIARCTVHLKFKHERDASVLLVGRADRLRLVDW